MLCSDFGAKNCLKIAQGGAWLRGSAEQAAHGSQQGHFGKVGKPDLMFSPHSSQPESCPAVPRRKESVPELQFFRPTGNKHQKNTQGYKNTTEVFNGSVPVPLRDEAALKVSTVNTQGWLSSSHPALRGCFPHLLHLQALLSPSESSKKWEVDKNQPCRGFSQPGLPGKRAWTSQERTWTSRKESLDFQEGKAWTSSRGEPGLGSGRRAWTSREEKPVLGSGLCRENGAVWRPRMIYGHIHCPQMFSECLNPPSPPSTDAQSALRCSLGGSPSAGS